MNKINSIEELKTMASLDGGLDCFILLKSGVRSSKHISYDINPDEFWIDNFIDGSFQKLEENELETKTNIIEAIKKGAFYTE